jgi:hypothetical protein
MDGTPAKWKYSQSIGLQSLPEEFHSPGGFLWQFINRFSAHKAHKRLPVEVVITVRIGTQKL